MQSSGADQICHVGAAYGSVRQLRISASRLATDIFTGEYRSAFRGRGIEFDQVREYQPGDDVRSIDWNVTARLGRPFIKSFVEERELTVVLAVDRSPSMCFGTLRATKVGTACEAAALLAFAALRSHDKTALLTFGDGPLRYLRPGKGKRHTLQLLEEKIAPGRGGAEDGLESALQYLEGVLKRRCVVCLVSDFLPAVPLGRIASLASRHDVVALAVSDPAEHELPDAGLLSLRDPETELLCRVDCSNAAVRDAFRERSAEGWQLRRNLIQQAGAEFVPLTTGSSPAHALTLFFRGRSLRRRP